jgi:catalase
MNTAMPLPKGFTTIARQHMDVFYSAFTLGLVLLSAFPTMAVSDEQISENEAAATQQIVQMIEAGVHAEAKNGLAHRDAHPKAHGCVQAEFRVLPKLSKELQVGIFAEPRVFPAWIRYSNGSGKIQADKVGDARGMAIKLMGVELSASNTLDFLMINHPVFLVRNAADYVEFQKAVSADIPSQFFFPGWNPFNFRLHEFGIVNAIQNKKVANPLDTRYWSTTPYLFGTNTMKFSARPCGANSLFAETSTPDFLRENMSKQLAQGQGCFDFLVQLRSHPLKMPIEDPTIEWDEKDAPFFSVARITIPSQKFDSPEQQAQCENLSFTPRHTIQDHQPIGGINRVRQTVYETVSRVRHEINGTMRLEPTGF